MIVSFSSPTDRDKKEYVLIGMRPSCLDDKVKITAIDDDSHVGVLFMGLDTYMRLGEDYIRENVKLQHYSSMDMWCLEVSQNNYYNDQAKNPDKIIPVKFMEVEAGPVGRCIAVRMAAIICARCPGVNRLQSGIYAESAGYLKTAASRELT